MSSLLPMDVRIRLVRKGAVPPERATDGAACFDLRSAIRASIKPGHRRCIPCGLAFAIPDGYEGLIRPRSGLGRRHGLHVALGTIDSDYRGEVSAMLVNLGGLDIAIEPGQRIAQLAIRPVPQVRFVVVDRLDETDRGDGGWGSTGDE